MMCRDCGTKLEVVKTMVLEDATQRLRECRCGSRFLTTEVVTRKLPALPVTARQPPDNSSPQSSSSDSDLSLSISKPDPDQTPARVEPVVRTFLVAGKDAAAWALTESFHKKLTAAYPGVDATAEYAKVDVWAEANPAKRKTPRGMKAFLHRWFEKAQNDAARKPKTAPADPRCAYHRALGTRGKLPRFGAVGDCPECKHALAAARTRASDPTPVVAIVPATRDELDRARKEAAGG